MTAKGSATLTQLWQGLLDDTIGRQGACRATSRREARCCLACASSSPSWPCWCSRPPAAAEVRTVAEVHTPDRGGRTAFPVIDAFGGAVAWSDYASGAWRLMANVGGVTRALPVAPRRTPFDVDLGPDGRGGTIAVYSRCARGLNLDLPTPQHRHAARRGCDLHAFSFTSGRETAVAGANSRADEYWPSVWGGRIAFVRAYPGRRDPDRTATPYLYVRSREGSGRSRRLRRPSSVVTIRMRGQLERQRLSTMIEGLDMRARTVAYAWSRSDGSETHSFIYLAARGGEPVWVARCHQRRRRCGPRPNRQCAVARLAPDRLAVHEPRRARVLRGVRPPRRRAAGVGARQGRRVRP